MCRRRRRVDGQWGGGTGGGEGAQVRVERAGGGWGAGPVGLAVGGEPVEEIGGGEGLVRFGRAVGADGDRPVGLLRGGGDKPAGPVVFERAAHQHLPFAQQRCGNGITRKAAHWFAIEAKAKRAGAVD